jgi:hypothetical protein
VEIPVIAVPQKKAVTVPGVLPANQKTVRIAESSLKVMLTVIRAEMDCRTLFNMPVHRRGKSTAPRATAHCCPAEISAKR